MNDNEIISRALVAIGKPAGFVLTKDNARWCNPQGRPQKWGTLPYWVGEIGKTLESLGEGNSGHPPEKLVGDLRRYLSRLQQRGAVVERAKEAVLRSVGTMGAEPGTARAAAIITKQRESGVVPDWKKATQ